MKRLPYPFAFAGLGLLLAGAAFAATQGSPLKVEHGWVRWLPANLPAAGYAVIRNDGDQPVKLIGADSDDYGMAMLHRSMQQHGKDTMERMDALSIPAHGEVKLAPGGYHFMLMDATHPIKPGDTVTIDLQFDNQETLKVSWPVRPANATGP
jgi:copper(I)-binding protein